MILEIKGLKKAFGSAKGAEGFTLDIPEFSLKEGEITALIGPSGAGKSTLMNIINGLTPADEGTLTFKGEKWGARPSLEQRRQMAMVFQKPALFNASLYDNMAYGLKARGVGKEDIRIAVESMAEKIGLAGKLRQKSSTLSGGEAGRVAIARALLVKPALLLLDEPTGNLDPSNVAIIEELIKDGRKEFKTTVLITTHNMFQTKRLADRVAFLLGGSLVEFGSKEGIFEKAQKPETQAFIKGDMIY